MLVSPSGNELSLNDNQSLMTEKFPDLAVD